VNVGSNLPFQFTWRGRNFRDATGAEFARIVEERDRELEEFLATLMPIPPPVTTLTNLGAEETMTNIDFGDYEPEDGWDAGDPVVEQLENLRRRIILLVKAGNDGTWGAREITRAQHFDEDLRFVIERIFNGEGL